MLIKKILYRILPLKIYLQLVSKLYFLSYNSGKLKNSPFYENHYYAQNLIKEGDVVLDIGANLGYYSALFSRWVGKSGRVLAVEPVRLYAEILKTNIKSQSPYPENVSIFPFGLGDAEKQTEMKVPIIDGVLSQGRSHVAEVASAQEAYTQFITFQATIQTPQVLFTDLSRLDYIKIDTEGYEMIILKAIMYMIRAFKPIVFVESGAENSPQLFEMLTAEGYELFTLASGMLHKVGTREDMPKAGYEFYGIPIK